MLITYCDFCNREVTEKVKKVELPTLNQKGIEEREDRILNHKNCGQTVFDLCERCYTDLANEIYNLTRIASPEDG